MSKIDWSKAPEGAEFYAGGRFRRLKGAISGYPLVLNSHRNWVSGGWSVSECKEAYDYEPRPTEWPETDDRITAIAQNGGDGLHYMTPCDGDLEGEQLNAPRTSAEFLSACLQVQSERGRQYDASGTGGRSFAAAAVAFNAVTGRDLKGSDVCLILEMVKLVRQYSSPDRIHADSMLDKVSYSALWAEQITAELLSGD